MKIFVNNEIKSYNISPFTIQDLVEEENINPLGTAIAVNDRIIKKENWKLTKLSDMDHVTIIRAAYGG